MIKRAGLIFFIAGLAMAAKAQDHQSNDSILLTPQKDLIDVVKKWFKMDQNKIDSSRAKKKFQFSFIPAAGNSAGGGRAIATAFNAAFYTGNEKTTSLSAITFSPWFTLNGKFVLPFRNLVWLPNDVLLWRGDTRFMIYTQDTWGLGGNTNPDQKVLLEYNYVRFYHSFLKRAGKTVLFGAGYNLDYHFNTSLAEDTTFGVKVPVYDYENEFRSTTVSSGPVLNFLIDKRRNSINPPGGVYFAVDYRFNPKFLGSTFDWQSIWVDARKYFSFDKQPSKYPCILELLLGCYEWEGTLS